MHWPSESPGPGSKQVRNAEGDCMNVLKVEKSNYREEVIMGNRGNGTWAFGGFGIKIGFQQVWSGGRKIVQIS